MYIKCMKTKRLELLSEDKKFYRLVEKATFGNPFSLEREQTLQELTGFTSVTGQKLSGSTLRLGG